MTVDGKSGGAWIAQELITRIGSIQPSKDDLRSPILSANAEIRRELLKRMVDVNDKASVPAASFVAVVAAPHRDALHLVQVGDCQALVANGHAGTRHLFARQQEPFDHRAKDAVNRLRRHENAGVVETEAESWAIQNRLLMNVPGGYGTIAGDPGVAEFIVTQALSPQPVLLTSDGVLDVLSETELDEVALAALEGRDVEPVASALRAAIGDDCPPDDISVVLFVPEG